LGPLRLRRDSRFVSCCSFPIECRYTSPVHETSPDSLPPPLPPETDAPASVALLRSPVRWRWWIHLLFLSAYPISIGVLGALLRDRESAPALSDSLPGLMMTVAQTYVFFGFFFGIAWLASRARASDLMLHWGSRWKPWLLGFGYAIALQIVVRIVVLIILFAVVLVLVVQHQGPVTGDSISEQIQEVVRKFRPETERLVDNEALVTNPYYLLATMTLVSFAMAGFTEELWRAGMLAGFCRLFPGAAQTGRGKALFVGLVAAVFGLGHLTQGAGAVVLTGIIGVQLGAIMLYHRSMWIAALAHGFFDAFSFLTLWWVQSHPEMLRELEQYLQNG